MKIIVLEVKSEETLQSKLLKAFHADHPSVSYLRTSMADYREQEWMKNIPLYALRQ